MTFKGWFIPIYFSIFRNSKHPYRCFFFKGKKKTTLKEWSWYLLYDNIINVICTEIRSWNQQKWSTHRMIYDILVYRYWQKRMWIRLRSRRLLAIKALWVWLKKYILIWIIKPYWTQSTKYKKCLEVIFLRGFSVYKVVCPVSVLCVSFAHEFRALRQKKKAFI